MINKYISEEIQISEKLVDKHDMMVFSQVPMILIQWKFSIYLMQGCMLLYPENFQKKGRKINKDIVER